MYGKVHLGAALLGAGILMGAVLGGRAESEAVAQSQGEGCEKVADVFYARGCDIPWGDTDAAYQWWEPHAGCLGLANASNSMGCRNEIAALDELIECLGPNASMPEVVGSLYSACDWIQQAGSGTDKCTWGMEAVLVAFGADSC